jgi:hypothetical protein
VAGGGGVEGQCKKALRYVVRAVRKDGKGEGERQRYRETETETETETGTETDGARDRAGGGIERQADSLSLSLSLSLTHTHTHTHTHNQHATRSIKPRVFPINHSQLYRICQARPHALHAPHSPRPFPFPPPQHSQVERSLGPD